MSASSQLRGLLASPRCEHLLEAHNALSAMIVESAGIPGIWASSLTLSCSYGMRDNSELTMTQVLELLETMTARVSAPILFDGDTGYGQFSHFQQLVKKLCARGIAGVCIEDKLFPKTNSFIRSEEQQLASAEEFCGKLRAGKDAQPDPEFVIVARTEALITGCEMSEALDRASRYVEAGADAILVHSKERTFAQVREFMDAWDGAAPVVCVPTTYYSTPQEAFENAGISLAIWANHLLRASVSGMQEVARLIAESGSIRGVEDLIAPVKELFRLQDTRGLEEAERVYAQASTSRAIVLAASRGDGLDELTLDRPKCMIPIGGVPAIDKALANLRAEGVRDVSIVRGYCKEALAPEGVTFFDNLRWDQTGEVGSLAEARPALKGDVVLLYGDVVFKRYILHELMSSDAPITIVVDGSRSFRGRSGVDRVRVSARAPAHYDESDYHLVEISEALDDEQADGEWIGMARVTGEGTELFSQLLDEVMSAPDGEEQDLSLLFNRLVERDPKSVRVLYVQGDWLDINDLSDVAHGQSA